MPGDDIPAGPAEPAAGGGPLAGAASARVAERLEDRRHWGRIIGLWVVLSAVADLLFYYAAGPHIPPGTMSNTADGAQFDFNVLIVAALPVDARRMDLHGLCHRQLAGVAGRPGAGRRPAGP